MSTRVQIDDFLLSSRNKDKSSKIRQKKAFNRQISNYSIKHKIGVGSYAKVYKAIHKPTGQPVAVKVFSKSKMTRQEIQRTRDEVEIHKKLLHSNIARIYEFSQNDEKIFIFMEYCQNGELFNYINQNGPLPQKFAATIFRQILSAMKYLKDQRIFHRDIKCQNILFDRNWSVKLIDFGFATKKEEGDLSTTFCGSPSYTAPQLAKKNHYCPEMVDVWCLGVTLYAMLSAQLPFQTKKKIMQISYQIKNHLSQQAKQIIKKIFVEDEKRATIQELQKTLFVHKGYPINSKFINSETDEIGVDSNILDLMVNDFKVNFNDVFDSVTNFRLDQNYALYYLTVQKEIAKGNKVKSDIASEDFQKKLKPKRSTFLRSLQIGHRRAKSQAEYTLQNSLKITDKPKSYLFRVRKSCKTIDIKQSIQTQQKVMDLVLNYRKKL